MPIRTRVIMQCSGLCQRYLANGWAETCYASRAQTFAQQATAEEDALAAGWTLRPALCPDCQTRRKGLTP